MSKPISFGFGKPKSTTNGPAKVSTTISLPAKKPTSSIKPVGLKSRSALRGDDDDERDEEAPKHEEVTGFSSDGVILSKPVVEKKAVVIENQGNGDWRRRGQRAQGNTGVIKSGQDVVMVEKDEVSKASGLQLAPVRTTKETDSSKQAQTGTATNEALVSKPKTADEEALQALLNDDPNAPKGNAVIAVSENLQLRPADELAGFRSDIASRPDVSTLDEYAAMPVEEFGLAMLRGMGKKRRANGEVINVEPQLDNKKEIKKAKHEGFLGIGAKAAPGGLEGVELGAWGKADMRRNNRGEGFFTPVMVKDRETGETITEEELERRKKMQEGGGKGKVNEEDWRERRDKNLEKNGTERIAHTEYKDAVNDFSRRRRDEDNGHESSRSRRERDGDYDAVRSKRHRSRSRERRYKDDEKTESSSSRRDKDRDYDRDKGHDRDRYRDRHKDRDRDRDRDDRRYRDRDRR